MSTDSTVGDAYPGVLAQSAPADEPVKPGYLTSEFWKAAIIAVLGLLKGLGLIGPDFSNSTSDAVLDSAALLAAALASIGYSIARGRVKSAKALGTAAARAGNPLV
jgi:hypothetical protein